MRLPPAAWVVVLIALSGLSALARATPPTGPAGSLVVQCSTDGAEVFVDGALIGRIPLGGPVALSLGEHTIKVVRPGFAPFIDVFLVTRKRPAKLEIDLAPISGVLRVTSSVERARVIVDGKFVGEVPLTAEVDVGAHQVKVSRPGYRDVALSVAAVAGREIAVDAQLEELPVGLNPYKPPPAPPPRWYDKWWVWTAGAAGVVAIATAIVVPIALSNVDHVKDFGPSAVFNVNNR